MNGNHQIGSDVGPIRLTENAIPDSSLDARVLASFRKFHRKRRRYRVLQVAAVSVLIAIVYFWRKPGPMENTVQVVAAENIHPTSALVWAPTGVSYMTDLDLRGYEVANQGKIAVIRGRP